MYHIIHTIFDYVNPIGFAGGYPILVKLAENFKRMSRLVAGGIQQTFQVQSRIPQLCLGIQCELRSLLQH